MNVGIIGAGLIGGKRAEALNRLNYFRLHSVADLDIERARVLTEQYGGASTNSWREVITSSEISFIIICTQHDVAVEIAIEALKNGKHVLCEKPLGRNADEAKNIIKVAEQSGKKIMVGFNYRFYPHVMRAKELVKAGYIGEAQYMKATLGHAARPNYDKEWRVDPEKGGGGALLDPGVHIVDLARYLMDDELVCNSSQFQNAYWKIEYEDNVFVNSKTTKGKSVILHSSITEWKNTFSIEIIGSDGYLKLSGRGGFYGNPQISMNKRWAWLNGDDRSKEIVEFFSSDDDSFYEELKYFFDEKKSSIHKNATGYDGLAAAEFIDELYRN
jgi:predicted dehydrogenase